MTAWLTSLSVISAPGRRACGLLAALILLLSALAAPAAPEFVLSGRAPQLAKVVLAQTPLGPVTALDVLMLDTMTDRSLAYVPMTVWIAPGSPAAQPYRSVIQAAIERLVTYKALADRAGDWQPPSDQVRAMSFGAATAVWIEDQVRPQITALETDPAKRQYLETDINRFYLAHPEFYLRRQQAQVRYIFKKAKVNDLNEQQLARQQLDELAKQIKAGTLSFEVAASKHSDAPSTAQGGLVPPFINGTFFPAFEDAAFQLQQPGQLSLVFQGPDGFYLLQLVKSWLPANTPIAAVHDQIRDQLQLDLVRGYFTFMLEKLNEKHFIRNQSPFWDYLDLDAPVAQIDKTRLTRDQFLRFYENPTSNDYQVRSSVVLVDTAAWVEGETIMQDLEARGKLGHPWIERARLLATLNLRAAHVYPREVPTASYATVEAAVKTIESLKSFAQSLRQDRLVQITIEIRAPKARLPKAQSKDRQNLFGPGQEQPQPLTSAEQRAVETLAQTLSAQIVQGTLPVEPTPIKLSDWVTQARASKNLDAAIANLLAQAEKTPTWRNLRLQVKDAGYVSVIPGSEWQMLQTVRIGQVSPAQRVGTMINHYLVVDEKPVDINTWKGNPLQMRTLAFQIEASRLFHAELAKVRQSGAVKLTF